MDMEKKGMPLGFTKLVWYLVVQASTRYTAVDAELERTTQHQRQLATA